MMADGVTSQAAGFTTDHRNDDDSIKIEIALTSANRCAGDSRTANSRYSGRRSHDGQEQQQVFPPGATHGSSTIPRKERMPSGRECEDNLTARLS